ncbi:MAG TPA: DUF4115 domain-containing protein, partial [Paraburkholderia sp.]
QTTGEGANGASAPQADAQSGQQSADEGAAAANTQPAQPQGAQQGQEQGQMQPSEPEVVPNAPAQALALAPAQAATPANPAVVAGAQPTPAATPANAVGTSTFAIRVTQDTWVSVRQKDGKEVFSGLIHGSDGREIAGVAPLNITVGNKAGIESMTLDGQPVDTSKYASAKGNVARFVLP